jgi:precorrin-6B methylase 2
MTASIFPRRYFLALFLSLAVGAAFAQDKQGDQQYKPEVGQHGKDVVWVPTSQALVDKMLDLARVTPRDYVIDLGSGDGRTVITAAKRGARTLGIEYNPDMVALSERNAAREGVGGKAKFMKADLFETDLSQATVITMFLLPDINLKLRPKILDLKPGTRIVSNSFTMGEWSHDRSVRASEKEGCQTYCTAYLWIVPAKVAGTWRVPGGELTLKQEFQKLTGTLRANGLESAVKGRMSGDQISFKAGDAQYTGQVAGGTIKGTMKSGGGGTEWHATRTGK